MSLAAVITSAKLFHFQIFFFAARRKKETEKRLRLVTAKVLSKNHATRVYIVGVEAKLHTLSAPSKKVEISDHLQESTALPASTGCKI